MTHHDMKPEADQFKGRILSSALYRNTRAGGERDRDPLGLGERFTANDISTGDSLPDVSA
jgi:hypothetical protein